MPTPPDWKDALRRRAATLHALGLLDIDPDTGHRMALVNGEAAIRTWLANPRSPAPLVAIAECPQPDLLQRVLDQGNHSVKQAVLANRRAGALRQQAGDLQPLVLPTIEKILDTADAAVMARLLLDRPGAASDPRLTRHIAEVAKTWQDRRRGLIGDHVTLGMLNDDSAHELLLQEAPDLLDAPLNDVAFQVTARFWQATDEEAERLGALFPRSIFGLAAGRSVAEEELDEVLPVLVAASSRPDLVRRALQAMHPRILYSWLGRSAILRALCPADIASDIPAEHAL